MVQTALDSEIGARIFFKKLVENLMLASVVLVFAMLESLKDCSDFVHSYLSHKMLTRDGIALHDKQSLERVVSTTELIAGKSDFLTEKHLKPLLIYTCQQFSDKIDKIDPGARDLLCQSIIDNTTTACVELDDSAQLLPVGNRIDVSLLTMLQEDLGV